MLTLSGGMVVEVDGEHGASCGTKSSAAFSLFVLKKEKSKVVFCVAKKDGNTRKKRI